MPDTLAHSPTLAASGAPAADAGERLPAGHGVGEYVVEAFLGTGAMGEVYAGRHPVIGKRVAIKVLRRDAAGSEAAERMVREARATSQIDHPNVIDIFALGRLDDGRLYLVMDLVDGRSLRDVLRDGPLAPDEALTILDAIADALDAAHARGVIHRDLKPDNIMIGSARGHVSVLDFGLAKLVQSAHDGAPIAPGTLTGQGTWLGTPGYMAPEQWSVDGAGPASDRYALGVIAFELLAGVLPFAAASVPAMMEQHFRAAVPSVSSRGSVSLPSAVDDVLRRALAKDPAERFASARAMIDALREAMGTAVRAAITAKPRPAGRKLWLPAAAGAGVLGVGVIAAIAMRPGNSDDRGKPAIETHAAGDSAITVVASPDTAEVSFDGRVVPAKRVVLKRGASTSVVESDAGPAGSKRGSARSTRTNVSCTRSSARWRGRPTRSREISALTGR
jgi:serine/threonine-protein kinase